MNHRNSILTRSDSINGYLMILLSALLFGSYGIWSKIMGDDFGIYYQGWVRSAIVLAIVVPLMFVTKSYKKIDKGDAWWLMVPVLFGIGTQAPLYYAFNHLELGTATLIFYSMFVITSYVVARLYLGETITRVKMVAMLLGFLGLALIFGVSIAKFSLIALSLAALNGIASGGEVSTTKRSTGKYPSLMVSTLVWAGIFVTHLPMSLLVHEKQWPIALDANWAAMFAYSLAGLIAFWLVVEGFKFVDASIGSLIGLLEVVFGVIFGILFFGEHLSISLLAGGLLIIIAGMLPDLTAIINNKRLSNAEERKA